MKLSESNSHSVVNGLDAAIANGATADDASAGNIASSELRQKMESSVAHPQTKQGILGKLLQKRRRIFIDPESATDSETFTENEQHTSIDNQQTPAQGKHRPKTPKSKRDLLNLQSNLSPKYIGYANANSPTTVYDSDENMRTTRRRTHVPAANAINEIPSKDKESAVVAAAVVTSPKTIVSGMAVLPNGGYLSPIDKLLIKNGANSPNSTGFEADAEDAAAVQRKRKHQKRKLKRSLKPKTKDFKLTESTEKQPNKEVRQFTEMLLTKAVQAEDNTHELFSITDDLLKVSNEENLIESKETEEIDIKVKPDMLFALPSAANSMELEPLKSPPDLMEPVSNNDHSIKSPSSISIDSAKGSSIVTDSGWPTYQIGDLYWGKLVSYCYWPCMICPDEFNQIVGNAQRHPQRKSTDSVSGAPLPIQVHVRFFADNGRHNWIKSENLLPFAGRKAYDELREEVRIKYGPKSTKFRQMVAKQSKLHVWHRAIDEALTVGQVPYAERLQKFFEIYENSISMQSKEKRKRIKPVPQETSDVGSSLYDSMDNLYAKLPIIQLVSVKRERSVSPCSPAFSPVKHNHEKRSKRRKLSGSLEEPVGSTTPKNEKRTEKPNSPELTNYDNPEFGQLFDAIKEYVMVHRQEERLEKVLLAVVKNIWSLKQLQLRELDRDLANGTTELLGSARIGSERSRGVGTIKRLSNRLKSMMLRRSQTPVVTPSSTPVPSEPTQLDQRHLQHAKKPTGRPVEEVIDDILQLDRKYLFRGLNREPICKYCHKTGSDIQRCSRTCNSWMHAACLAEQHTPKSTNSRKAIEAAPVASQLLEPKSTPPPITDVKISGMTTPLHITADQDINEPNTVQDQLVCYECATDKPKVCCICRQSQLASNPLTDALETEEAELAAVVEEPSISSKLIRCSQPMCSNKFHASCCKYWPQANVSNIATARCPMHVCHTCVSNDPSGKYQQVGSSKLIKCVKCPATYHQDSYCIPAGSRLLTMTHLICPRHNIAKADANLNVLWCYICVRGGELVCCETCPIAVHAHCRNIPIKTNESYICEECESGRLPLYGEIVWAKFNNFRWWPAIILPPTEIPSNILKKQHGDNDFVVRFFGTNDHGWISRRRVYLYIEGDTGDGYKGKSLISKRYTAGVEEATRFLKMVKENRQDQLTGIKMHPLPYVKIKANKPVPPVRFIYNEEQINTCECNPSSEHPCGPESGCLNRMLYHECNPDYCPAGNKCENQLFELRKSPRLDVVYMNDRGFGLVCREPILEGDFIIEYVGEVINHSEFQRRLAQKANDRDENFYFLGVEKDFIIDAGPKGNLARFMNHSCEPNCATQKWTVNCINRVGLFAIKDIAENTELTFNYLWDDLINDCKKPCFCSAPRCSGSIGGKLKDDIKYAIKDTGTQSSKSKANSKLKAMQRGKTIRVHVNTAKNKTTKKPKSKQSSVDTSPTELQSESAGKDH